MITPESLPEVQGAIAEAGLDGWLLFDFHGLNPIARGLLGLEGLGTRRLFALIPREGKPAAIIHAIEQGPWRHWPREWDRHIYSRWRELEGHLASLVGGRKLAMEYSAGDAVPYLDRIPAGVLEMVRAAGAEVVSSAPLVSRFYACLSPAEFESHKRSAEVIAGLAQQQIKRAGEAARSGRPLHEHEVQEALIDEFRKRDLEWDHGPIVAAGENAADPHYETSAARPRLIRSGELLLIDLWAREQDGVFADQTWMGAMGEPSARAVQVWEAVRDARDAAIALLQDRLSAGKPIRGAEVDDASRNVIQARGFGDFFPHRTGHSIDARDLHGSGPHLDNLETREERVLIEGVAFSIEPGVYIRGEIGARTEVNAFIAADGLVVTPQSYQTDLIVA